MPVRKSSLSCPSSNPPSTTKQPIETTTMSDIKPVLKTDAQILAEHAEERTRCTVFTRVMGYHRPVETFNAGKQGEFEERAHFNEPGCACCEDVILK